MSVTHGKPVTPEASNVNIQGEHRQHTPKGTHIIRDQQYRMNRDQRSLSQYGHYETSEDGLSTVYVRDPYPGVADFKREVKHAPESVGGRPINPMYPKNSWAYYGYPEVDGEFYGFGPEVPSDVDYIKTLELTPTGYTLSYGSYRQDAEFKESSDFFTKLGYPEFAGRYAPFTIGEGKYVKSLTETPDNPATPRNEAALNIMFGDYAYDKQYLESVDFYTKLGYPEFAGRFDPFDLSLIPDPRYSRDSLRLRESDGKLIISYYSEPLQNNSPYGTDAFSSFPRQINVAGNTGVSQSEFNERVYGFNVLPVDKKISVLQTQLPSALNVVPKGVELTDITFKDNKFYFTYKPSQAQITAKENEFNALDLNVKINELNRLAPETLRDISLRDISGITFMDGHIFYSTGTSLINSPSTDSKDSKRFYDRIGYPEFSGKYEPFSIPNNATIQSVSEISMVGPLQPGQTRPTTLNIKYTTSNVTSDLVNKSLTEQLLDMSPAVTPIFPLSKMASNSLPVPSQNKYPFDFLIGAVVGSVESSLLGLGSFAASAINWLPWNKNKMLDEAIQSLPAPPPTVSSVLVGSVFGRSEGAQLLLDRPYYAAGTIAGDLLLAVGFNSVTPTFREIKSGVKYVRDIVSEGAPKAGLTLLKMVDPETGIYLKSVVLPNIPEGSIKGVVSQSVKHNISNPFIYKVANPVVDAALTVKNEVGAFVGPTVSRVFEPVTSSLPYSFVRSVVAPNLLSYSRVLSPSVNLLRERFAVAYSESGLKPIGDVVSSELKLANSFFKYDVANPIVDMGLYLKGETVDRAATFVQRSSDITRREFTLFKYNTVDPIIEIARGKVGESVTIGQRGVDLFVRQPTDYASTYLKVNYGTYIKPLTMEAKGYSEIVMGKMRYDLNIEVPASKVPHEYSPWKSWDNLKAYPIEHGAIIVPSNSKQNLILEQPKTVLTEKYNYGSLQNIGFSSSYEIQVSQSTPQSTKVPSVLDRLSPFPMVQRTKYRPEESYSEFYYSQFEQNIGDKSVSDQNITPIFGLGFKNIQDNIQAPIQTIGNASAFKLKPFEDNIFDLRFKPIQDNTQVQVPWQFTGQGQTPDTGQGQEQTQYQAESLIQESVQLQSQALGLKQNYKNIARTIKVYPPEDLTKRSSKNQDFFNIGTRKRRRREYPITPASAFFNVNLKNQSRRIKL